MTMKSYCFVRGAILNGSLEKCRDNSKTRAEASLVQNVGRESWITVNDIQSIEAQRAPSPRSILKLLFVTRARQGMTDHC